MIHALLYKHIDVILLWISFRYEVSMVIVTSQRMDMVFLLSETTAESVHLRFSPYCMSHLYYTIFHIMCTVDLALFVLVLVLQKFDSEIATHLYAE